MGCAPVTHALPFDGADMDENVGAAGVRLDEPEAFRCIERFHSARGHGALLSNKPTNLAEPLFIARRSLGDQRWRCRHVL
jgi:hypothetical protein